MKQEEPRWLLRPHDYAVPRWDPQARPVHVYTIYKGLVHFHYGDPGDDDPLVTMRLDHFTTFYVKYSKNPLEFGKR